MEGLNMEGLNLPQEFTAKMKGLLGEEWEAFADCYEHGHYQALRFNPLKKGVEKELYPKLLEELLVSREEPVPWAENAYYYGEEARPGKHPYHEAGLFYIQEPSAMSAASLLAPEPGMRVLDLCAAPGGKTTQLAAALGQRGLLIANEIHPARAKILSQNVERMGICNAIVTNEDSGKLAEYFPAYFHAILVDAPCSGEGMFRKNPEAMGEWSGSQVGVCAKRQREILDNAAKMLLPGGRLVYSTCTFSPEENEMVIDSFLREHSDFSVEKTEAPWFSPGRAEWISGKGTNKDKMDDEQGSISDTFRLWPHKLHGEGHFAAVVKKRGSFTQQSKKMESSVPVANKERKRASVRTAAGGGPNKMQLDILKEFLGQTFFGTVSQWILEGKLQLFKDQLYRLPEDSPSLQGIRVLRAGLHIGEYKKNRFEPSHALALSLGFRDVSLAVNLHLADVRTEAFLRGESLTVTEEDMDFSDYGNGWCLVCVNGFSLGWGKIANGQLKNHYPRGLRR